MWISSFPNTIYWRHYSFPFWYSSHSGKFLFAMCMGLFFGSPFFWSMCFLMPVAYCFNYCSIETHRNQEMWRLQFYSVSQDHLAILCGSICTIWLWFCWQQNMISKSISYFLAGVPSIFYFDVVVIQLFICVQLCNAMDCSTPGFPVLHHLTELV